MSNGGVLSSHSVPPDLRVVVYRVAIAAGGEREWDYLWFWYKNTTNPYEKQICLSALAQSNEPWILSRSVQGKFYSSKLKDYMVILKSFSNNCVYCFERIVKSNTK